MRHVSHTQRIATAMFVAGALLAVVFSMRTASAQEPEDPVPEPGYIAQPGDEGYVIVPTPSPEDGVEGDSQHECEDDPLRAECAPAPPTGLRITRVGTTLSVHYTWSRWRGSNDHWYYVEIHRSSSSTGTYRLNRSDWDNVSPEDFSRASRGYHYKARAKRCRTRNVDDCGDWTSFVGPVEVPILPSRATDLELKWGKPTSPEHVRLTADFSGSLSSHDIVEIEHRRFDPTRGQVSNKYNIGLQTSSERSYSRDVDRGYEYRVRVRRCTDSGYTDCGQRTSWTSWLKIPKLATGLSISRDTDDLTAKYSREGTSYDRIDMRRRLIGGSGDGSSVADDLDVTGTSYGRDNVTRGYEYRFRIRRCVDRARTDCGGTEDWSGWSPWKVVPKLATGLSISRVTDDLTAKYSREGTSYDRIDMRRRLIGGSGDGSSVADDLDVTGTSYAALTGPGPTAAVLRIGLTGLRGRWYRS